MNERARNDSVEAAAEVTQPPIPSGAPQSMEQIYRTHHALVFRAAYRVTGNAEDAEDVLQTVFLRLMRREDLLTAVSAAESYLYRAAVNAALDLVRSRQRISDPPPDGAATAMLTDPAPAPDRAADSAKIRAWLRDAVARLHPTAAEMFALRFFEGRKNQEIAVILGTSPGSVAVTLHRTRERLEREFRAKFGGCR